MTSSKESWRLRLLKNRPETIPWSSFIFSTFLVFLPFSLSFISSHFPRPIFRTSFFASFPLYFRYLLFVTSIRIFSIPFVSLSRKMSPSLSRMSTRVQVEFHAGPRTMSLPVEMFDNIGHQGDRRWKRQSIRFVQIVEIKKKPWIVIFSHRIHLFREQKIYI